MDYRELLKYIVCPVCHGELKYLEDEPSGYECERCAIIYPIKESIPVMLPEKAVPAEEWRKEK